MYESQSNAMKRVYESNDESVNDPDPVAGLSSASACISLNCLGKYMFKPVFTHQCFDNERIRGYQPSVAAAKNSEEIAKLLEKEKNHTVDIKENNPTNCNDDNHRNQTVEKNSSNSTAVKLPHSSFQHHETASHHLSVSVFLSPSCRKCAILVESERKCRTRPKKRRRLTRHSSTTAMEEESLPSLGVPSKKRQRQLTFPPIEKELSSNNTAPPPSSRKARNGNITTTSNISHTKPETPTKTANSIGSGSTISSFSNSESLSESSFTLLSSNEETDEEENFSSPQGKTRRRRMETDEIVQRSGNALPSVVNCRHMELFRGKVVESKVTENSMSVRQVEEDYLSKPYGTVLYEYTRKVRRSGNEYEEEDAQFLLCLANGKDENIATYHNQVQKLALWFIETADNVDLTSNEGGGYWQVLYLFRKHDIINSRDDDSVVDEGKDFTRRMTRQQTKNDALSKCCITRSMAASSPVTIISQAEDVSIKKNRTVTQSKWRYSLVGYMTLFSFYSPFKKPRAGIVQRICQAIILPPYQRAGHGKDMLCTVYDIASGKYQNILRNKRKNLKEIEHWKMEDTVEINVEDPAPAFVALRDYVDFKLLIDNITRRDRPDKSEIDSPLLLPENYFATDSFEPLKDNDAISAGALAKITPKQIQIAYEMVKLQKLTETTNELKKSSGKEDEVEEIEKKFRLMVKKRLNRDHKEDLAACSTKKEKQAMLSEIFDATLMHYRKILRHI